MNDNNNFENHPIRIFSAYGQLKLDNVPSFVAQQIRDLLNESDHTLHEALRVADALQKTDMSIYRPEYAKKEISNQLRGPREKLHNILRKHIGKIDESIDLVNKRKKQLCTPKTCENPSEQIAQTLRMQEIRSLLRAKSYKEKIELIENDIVNGDGDFLKAVSDAPDQILHPDSLQKMQDKYIGKIEPSIQVFERQVVETKKYVRSVCAQLNSTQLEVMRSKGFTEDPLREEEHFQTFTPQTENEESIARQRIQRQMNKIREEENKERFDKENGGRSL